MLNISLPYFCEKDFTLHQTSETCNVLLVNNAPEQDFERYCNLFRERGGNVQEEYACAANRFAAIFDGKDAVFINYFRHTKELQIVTERDSAYFSFRDEGGAASLPPQVTQLHLKDFGMCYIIHLPDGRFILMDGGRNFTEDADRLFAFLQEHSNGSKPRIAAWIMTHPHSDHFYCFFAFMERYANEVEIESFFFNFPEYDDLEHYPKLKFEPDEQKRAPFYHIPKFYEIVKSTGAVIYCPHTGQRYQIGDARFTVLATIDDTIHCTNNINATSLIFMMELGGQRILWAADGAFGHARLPERYREELKADILQVPHHGFGSGPWEKEAEGYEYVQPPVCLLSATDYSAYYRFGPHKWGTRYLMTRMNVQEMITGDTTRTLTLPYFPAKHGAEDLAEKFRVGEAACGARAWVFIGLNTAEPEDLAFTILNMTQKTPEVRMELFFDSQAKNLIGIQPTVGRYSLTEVCLSDLAELPEGEVFALRISSDVPLVASNKNHKEAYHS